MKKVSLEFSKNATSYGKHNSIQNKVAQKLLTYVTTKPQYLLDLGCGDGAICKNITWQYQSFLGVDFAQGMLELHPKSPKIKTLLGDFNKPELFLELQTKKFDYIFSASALQWAEDLEKVFLELRNFQTPLALAIFTSNTFKTLHQVANIASPLRDIQTILELQQKYLNLKSEVVQYRLEFKSVREMFRYIKESGVSGSRNLLNYKQTKELMQNYPLTYLEFEVVFLYS